MRILVTGGSGYVGSVLVPELVSRGYKVRVIDRFFFGNYLKEYEDRIKLIKGDIRWCDSSVLKGIDVIIDLAALSNDPSGELDPVKTYEINYKGRVRIAKLGKKYGAEKYILASSASIYGYQEGIVDETSKVKPLTTYAKSAYKAEIDIKEIADKRYKILTFRKATIYGYSPRMRLDLVINAMIFNALKYNTIKVMRDGTQWRPFVHIKDVVRAYLLGIEKEIDDEYILLNVGSNEQNYQIISIVNKIRKHIGKNIGISWYGDPDKRSYRVRFDKIEKILKFKPKFDIKHAIKEITEAYESNKVDDSDIRTKTVMWYKELIKKYNEIKEYLVDGRLL